MSNYYNSNRKNNITSTDIELTLYAIFIIIFLVCCLYRPINKANNMREVTVTVTDKAVKNNGDSGKYLVFTEDANGNIATFEITDSFFTGRFDSSDVYAGIKVDNTYTFKVGGSRNELWSWYPNIYDYKLIETTETEE